MPMPSGAGMPSTKLPNAAVGTSQTSTSIASVDPDLVVAAALDAGDDLADDRARRESTGTVTVGKRLQVET